MAAGISAATGLRSCRFGSFPSKSKSPTGNCRLLFFPVTYRNETDTLFPRRRSRSLSVCFVMAEKKDEMSFEEEGKAEAKIAAIRVAKRLEKRKSERYTYLVAAVMSSFLITSMAIAAVYCRFAWQMEGGEVPFSEMFGTFALSVGAAVGMEFWARWAHRALWHASLWHMHESHHRPREGPFELNDVFAVINAVPAIGLLSYGFFNKGLLPGLCFGAIHHSDKFNGVPYGLFLGPKELEEVGGSEELEEEISKRIKRTNASKLGS